MNPPIVDDAQTTILCECLQKQIDELDMISSIFCNPGEFHMDDYSVAADINEYLQNKSTNLTRQLDYLICLQQSGLGKVEIKIELPHFYPALEQPSVTVRAGCFSTHQEKEIKKLIQDYIDGETVDKEEPYVYAIIAWIQDNLDGFRKISQSSEPSKDTPKPVEAPPKQVQLERIWIYSHHIKSKTKRQAIVRAAHDLDLTGFSKPGKPGIICVEGLRENTQEFWKYIRSMKWQKISIRIVESKNKSIDELQKYRRFATFREEIFTDLGDEGDDSDEATGEEVKMDMSVFMKFLKKYNSLYVRKELFGFE